MPEHISEKKTRANLIDPQLKKAGWNLSDRTKVGFEIPVSATANMLSLTFDSMTSHGKVLRSLDHCELPSKSGMKPKYSLILQQDEEATKI
jgi:hypothetical protein